MKILKTIFTNLLLVLSGNLMAQESLNAGGGESIGVGQASFSVGQVNFTTVESTSDDASQFQGVQIPFELYEVNSCPTDFNFDGTTDGEDFSVFLGNYNLMCAGCPTDFNEDGITDGTDFSFFLGNYGLDCPPSE